MYVCICNAVSDSDIRAEIGLGANSIEALSERLQVATGCGCCRDDAQAILDSTTSVGGAGHAAAAWLTGAVVLADSVLS